LSAGVKRIPASRRNGRARVAIDGMLSLSISSRRSPPGLSRTRGVGGALRMSTISFGGVL
jgi:hypothetical protein